jgi:hypothetical protein
MLGENWAEMMVFSYKITKKKITYVFYISAIISGNIFILNLVASLLIQKFKYIKFKKNQYPDLTVAETEWLKLQKIMMKYKPIQEYIVLDKNEHLKKNNSRFNRIKIFYNYK